MYVGSAAHAAAAFAVQGLRKREPVPQRTSVQPPDRRLPDGLRTIHKPLSGPCRKGDAALHGICRAGCAEAASGRAADSRRRIGRCGRTGIPPPAQKSPHGRAPGRRTPDREAAGNAGASGACALRRRAERECAPLRALPERLARRKDRAAPPFHRRLDGIFASDLSWLGRGDPLGRAVDPKRNAEHRRPDRYLAADRAVPFSRDGPDRRPEPACCGGRRAGTPAGVVQPAG